MNDLAPSAVGDPITIRGKVTDNLPGGDLQNHTVEVTVDGAFIGATLTDQNGTWSLTWTVPETLSVGNHSVEAFAPQQGFYRQSSVAGTLSIAYHTEISLEISQPSVTRGEAWTITGRLYDADTVGSPGLVGRSINVEFDGVIATTVITGTSGLFSFELPADSSFTRGEHQITVIFQGEELYLPAIANSSVLVRANIDVHAIFL